MHELLDLLFGLPMLLKFDQQMKLVLKNLQLLYYSYKVRVTIWIKQFSLP